MGRALAVFQAFRAANRGFDKTANFKVVDKQSLPPKTEVLGKPHKIKPKQTRYDCLETDEFWTHVGKKKNKVRLIYR
jgi:hypothetical protein